jgi:hypothetical protein
MVPMRPAAPGFGGGIPRGFAPGGGFFYFLAIIITNSKPPPINKIGIRLEALAVVNPGIFNSEAPGGVLLE